MRGTFLFFPLIYLHMGEVCYLGMIMLGTEEESKSVSCMLVTRLFSKLTNKFSVTIGTR